MNDAAILQLKFPSVEHGKFEIPWDLRALLYAGGAATKARLVADRIDNGTLGAPIMERLTLVKRLHEYIEGKLVGGGRRGTADTIIRRLREFFSWVDMADLPMTLESAPKRFIEWTDHLLHRQRIAGEISELHAYQSAVAVASVLDDVLERKIGLLTETRIRRPKLRRVVLPPKTDKQNLEQTRTFGHALCDITDALTVDAIRGPIPVSIRFRTGQVIEEWLRLKPAWLLKTLSPGIKPSTRLNAIAKREAFEADVSLRTRYPLINLRIEAEMLIFVAQTGMSLEQVYTLPLSKFRYQSHLDGYQVFRVYKARRQGEVAFDVFSEYREFFERYLAWRETIFPDDQEGRLFPLICAGRETLPPAFSMVQKYCKKLGIRMIRTRELRKTRINWLLRRSCDPAMVSDMHAHLQETLIRHYEQPSLQIAMIEINRFHSSTDPAIAPPAPGSCVVAIPQTVPNAPAGAPDPDCISPAGCLFCVHHRDIDSEDHVWSLASYRYLKSLELARYRPSSKDTMHHPAAAAVDQVTLKLKELEQSSEIRRLWVREAFARVEEEHHHPRWDGFIRLVEARS